MYKLGIIGDRESTLCFLPLGFSVVEANTAREGIDALREMVKSETFAVILVVEALAMQISEEIARYKDAPLPAVLVIPGRGESTGYALAQLKQAVERAAGTDILK